MKPYFTFVIPCYNSADTISQCLASIIDQDFVDYEVICVLDGPDDIAKTIIESFPVKCEVIEHGGVQKARNHGLKLAQGKFVMFSDCDFIWEPGILRVFKETLDKTGADFAYSGYRWSDKDGGHIPPEFDPHLLTTMNICDGSNPVKTDLVRKIGGWDEDLKRFQDWDLWLRVVKAGGVGVKVPNNGKSTFYPKKGDISGQDNYAESYKKIREKHGIDRKILVTSLAAPGHALRVAALCGWDYWPDPTMLPNDYDAIYLLGCFPEAIQDHVRMFLGFNGQPRDCKYLVHWIGTDVLNMRMLVPFLQARSIRDMFKKRGVINLCQSKVNQEEMEEIGFELTHLPLPVEARAFDLPMPEKFTIACYDHNGQDKKWHRWLISEVAKALPDIDFLFFGNKLAEGKSRNMEWVGEVKLPDILKRSSCLIRLTVHDGYPVSPIEFMYSGRHVITNVKDMPFTNYFDVGEINPDRFEEIKSGLIQKIREVQKLKAIDYKKVMKHYETVLNPVTFKKKIEGLVYAKD